MANETEREQINLQVGGRSFTIDAPKGLSDNDVIFKAMAADPEFRSAYTDFRRGALGTQAQAAAKAAGVSQPGVDSASTQIPGSQGPMNPNNPMFAASDRYYKVNAPGMFQPGEGAGLPLKIAAGVMGAMAPGSGIVDALPSAKRASAGYEAVRAVVGKSPVEMTDAIGQRLTRLQQLKDAGNAMPMAVRKLILRTQNAEKGPLTYDEARDFYTTLSRLSANERMSLVPQVSREVGSLVANLGQTIEQTAQSGGKLQQYLRAMQEYRRLSILRDARESMIKAAKKSIPYVATGAAAGGALEAARRFFQ